MICVLAWRCLCWRKMREGIAYGKIWIFYIRNHAFSCIFIFVHGMILDVKTVMAIGNKRYSHSAQKHETIMQNIGEGAYTMLSLNQTIGWTYHPCPITLVSAPMRRWRCYSHFVRSVDRLGHLIASTQCPVETRQRYRRIRIVSVREDLPQQYAVRPPTDSTDTNSLVSLSRVGIISGTERNGGTHCYWPERNPNPNLTLTLTQTLTLCLTLTLTIPNPNRTITLKITVIYAVHRTTAYNVFRKS